MVSTRPLRLAVPAETQLSMEEFSRLAHAQSLTRELTSPSQASPLSQMDAYAILPLVAAASLSQSLRLPQREPAKRTKSAPSASPAPPLPMPRPRKTLSLAQVATLTRLTPQLSSSVLNLTRM